MRVLCGISLPVSDVSSYLMVSARVLCCDISVNQYQALSLHFHFLLG